LSEANKNLVRRYFDALDRFDLDEIKALMDPDMRFRCAGGTGARDSVVFHSPDELINDLQENVKVLYESVPGLEPEILNLMAEDDGVAAEVRIRGRSIQTGDTYDNLYAFFFWIRADRFVEIHEHLDTQYVAQTLLAPAGIASGADMPWLRSKEPPR
jgi:ketosteroid isomerase-like protein